MEVTPNGETENPGASQTPATPAATPAPVQDNGSAADVERLRKEKEQAQMRINQLEKEAEARKKADEEAQQKRLEEQNEYKSLFEQEKAKREAIENERQEAETKEQKRLAEETIFAEFSQEAIEVAKEAGLALKDDSDEAKADFKQRLEKISQRVTSNAGVTPNNPGVQEQTVDRSEQVQRMRMGDKNARDQVINSLPVLDVMRKQAGYTSQQ